MDNTKLTAYLSSEIQKLIADVMANTLKNPRQSAYFLEYAAHSKKAAKIRAKLEQKGQHIPVFLIASITDKCNLHCNGCYARGTGLCQDEVDKNKLTAAKWNDIFAQAEELGIAFILLSGGEPMMRREVIEIAARHKKIIFPIFTNGTMFDQAYLDLFDRNRNLIPIVSLEGDRSCTDKRRGEGVYEKLTQGMNELKAKKLLFGTSLTLNKENMTDIMDEIFIGEIKNQGCRLVFFIEYVPIEHGTEDIAFSDADREVFLEEQDRLRAKFPGIIFNAFPGDEKELGGCLAAGRGFFHINPYGAAEACPFSPYADCSVKDSTLIEALQSPFFRSLQEQALVGGEHKGGCALFENQEQVQAALAMVKTTDKDK